MIWVETSFGRVPVWGSFATSRPLVLAIRGAFPAADHLSDLSPDGCDLALLHLPGFHSPRLRTTSIMAFASAFDEVIGQVFSGRNITALGLSTGSLTALALQRSEIKRVLAVEPFFSTSKLWPLIEFVRRELQASQQPALHEWCDEILGVSSTGVVNRDYRHVLTNRDRPASGLVGDIPLNPVRPIMGLPSLTDDEDRSLLTCRVVGGGHNLPTATIHSALADLHQKDNHSTVSAGSGAIATAATPTAGR